MNYLFLLYTTDLLYLGHGLWNMLILYQKLSYQLFNINFTFFDLAGCMFEV